MAHFQTKEFESLVDSLGNDIGTSKSARVIVPVSHIYLEYLMNLLLEKTIEPEEFVNIQNDRYFGFKKKLDRLNKMGKLSADEYHDLDLINDTRNDFMHEFKPDLEIIHKRIMKMKFHIYNDKANPLKAIIDDILSIMMFLEQKIINA